MPVASFYRLELFGPFRLVGPDGVAIPIASRKARALIAVLALSSRGERSRSALQDLLWSRCERKEAQNSLRRELSSLRKVLAGSAPTLLSACVGCVRLDRSALLSDWDPRDVGNESWNGGVFLEGLDLPGEEPFEEWLREHRIKATELRRPLGARSGFEIARTGRPSIGLMPVQGDEADPRTAREGEFLVDRFGGCLVETSLVDVVDYRIDAASLSTRDAWRGGPDLLLTVRIARDADEVGVSARATRVVTGGLLLARHATYPTKPTSGGLRAEYWGGFVRDAVAELMHVLARTGEKRDGRRPPAEEPTPHAAEHLLWGRFPDQPEARRDPRSAFPMASQGTLPGWRACCATFRHDTPGSSDHSGRGTLKGSRDVARPPRLAPVPGSRGRLRRRSEPRDLGPKA